MKIQDILEETYSSLVSNKVRTGLTMLGIIIGIASVIAMVSVGSGVQSNITSNIESLGSNLLTIRPGATQSNSRGAVAGQRGSQQTLKNEDIDVIKSISQVSYVSPEIQSRYQIVSPSTGNNSNSSVIGCVSDYATVHNMTIQEGSFLSDQNEIGMSKVAVIGPTVMTDLFGDGTLSSDVVGDVIKINKIQFKIIGVLAEKGGTSFSSTDEMIFVPLSVMQKNLSGQDYLSSISISVADKNQMDAVSAEISSALMIKHNVAVADFSIQSQADLLSSLNSVTTTLTLFLASVAGISLVVGGIGIMNMMLTAVTERTREIGLKKSIGARNKDISSQFLTESIVLTFVGGLIGVALGWLIAVLISKFAGVSTQVSIQSIIVAFGVSAAIGIIFGYYPSRRAASLNPIEALRYE